MHPLDTATALIALPDGRFAGHTSPAYANMVGPFGGITAACMLKAALLHPARIGEPVALTANFASALADGEFLIAAEAVRTNRSTQHWIMKLEQNGEVAMTATAVFAVRRETWSAPESQPPSDIPPAASLARQPTLGRPAWTKHYDMRFAEGGLPDAFDGVEQATSVSHVWLSDDPPRSMDVVSLASLCDSFYPRVFFRRRKWLPIGTVSLTTFFHADADMLALQGARPVLGVARGVNFRNGYFDQSAEVWGDDGRMLASSHQVVYYRD